MRSDEKQGLRLEERGRLLIISLCAPPNRFSLSMIHRLNALVEEVKTRSDIGALWLRAEGSDFSQGADLRDGALAAKVMTDDASRRELARLGQSLIEQWMALPIPTIVACQGNVLGAGACLMAASSFRLATPDARCGFPEVGLGMSLSWGVLPRLVREFGPSWTRRLVLAGERVPMGQLGPGAVRIVPVEELDKAALILAEELAQKPALAMRHSVESLLQLDSEHQSHAADDDLRFALTAGSEEFKRAVMRFLGGEG